MAAAAPSGLSLFELSRIVARHWRLSVGVFVGTAVVTLAVLWLLPRNYRSESKLYLRLGRETTSLDPTAMIGRNPATPTLPSLRENEINSVTDILLSRIFLERVVDSISTEAILDGSDPADKQTTQNQSAQSQSAQGANLSGDLTWPQTTGDRERAIVKLQSMIQVQAVKKSDIVKVTCETHNPLLSQQIVARLIDFYLADHLRMNRTPGAYEFLEHQTSEVTAELTRAEEKLRTLKDQTGLASPDVQRDLLVTRAGRLQDELFTTDAAIASAEAEVRLLRDRLVSLPKTTTTARVVGIPKHAAEIMRNQLYGLEIAEQDLTSKYTDEHFAVKQIRERTDAAKKVLEGEVESRDQVTTGPNGVYDQIELALAKQEPLLSAQRAKAESLRIQLAQVQGDIRKFNSDELQLAQLTRDLQRHETNYQAYAQHLEQTRIDQALEAGRISSINIIQPASFEPKSVGPKFLTNFFLGLVFGLIGAIGLPLILEARDLPLNHPHDLENHLGIPVLGAIPRFRAEQLARNGNGKNS